MSILTICSRSTRHHGIVVVSSDWNTVTNKKRIIWRIYDKNCFVGFARTNSRKWRVVLFGLEDISNTDSQRWVRLMSSRISSNKEECNYLGSCWATYLNTIFLVDDPIPVRNIEHAGNWQPPLALNLEQLATLILMKENSYVS